MQTKLVGILNYTPDSFSDSGEAFSLSAALKKLEQMFADGADIVDIGATATSYGRTLLTASEEWERVKSLLQVAAPLYGNRLSFDTFHHDNAQKAIDLGVCMINDVSGAKNQEMRQIIAINKHIKYVFMYSLVLPAHKSFRAKNKHEIFDFASRTLDELVATDIERERIIFDPGIGFATDPKLSFEIIAEISFLKELGLPTYIGHSRKSFLEDLSDKKPQDRDIETLAASLFMILQHVDYLRVHNVAIHARSLQTWRELERHSRCET